MGKKDKQKAAVKFDRNTIARYGYGNIPDELKPFLKKQCQIESVMFFCRDAAPSKDGGFIFSDVIFYEFKEEAVGDQVYRNKFWMFYDTMTMKFIDGHILLGFNPCVSNQIIDNTILEMEDIGMRGSSEDAVDEELEEVKPAERPAKRQGDPFGRDKIEDGPAKQ